ncbi:hypothetical protein PTKIN_Ptkin16aG0054300 [Pterospermum kingtungense]
MVVFMDFVFTKGNFNDRSISLFSRNLIAEEEREIAVVGERGKFRMAKRDTKDIGQIVVNGSKEQPKMKGLDDLIWMDYLTVEQLEDYKGDNEIEAGFEEIVASENLQDSIKEDGVGIVAIVTDTQIFKAIVTESLVVKDSMPKLEKHSDLKDWLDHVITKFQGLEVTIKTPHVIRNCEMLDTVYYMPVDNS